MDVLFLFLIIRQHINVTNNNLNSFKLCNFFALKSHQDYVSTKEQMHLLCYDMNVQETCLHVIIHHMTVERLHANRLSMTMLNARCFVGVSHVPYLNLAYRYLVINLSIRQIEILT